MPSLAGAGATPWNWILHRPGPSLGAKKGKEKRAANQPQQPHAAEAPGKAWVAVHLPMVRHSR
jgi:hypothetical protein